MAPQGENYFHYVPGQPRPQPPPIDEADYGLILHDLGKTGPQGWQQRNPQKFPSRRITYLLLETEDPTRGGAEIQVSEYISLSPKAVFRIYDLAEASGYTEEIGFDPPTKPGDPNCRLAAEAIDRMLHWIKDQGIVLTAHVGNEE